MPQKINLNETKKELSKYRVLDSSFYSEISDVIYESRRFISYAINHQLVIKNLFLIRKFLRTFQITYTLCTELRWSHFRAFIRDINDKVLRTSKIFQTMSGQLTWSHLEHLFWMQMMKQATFVMSSN